MSQYWSKLVHSLTPYVPGEQPKINNLIKLNTNENPYGPSPKVIAALQKEAADSLRLYPDPNSDGLKQAIAEYHGLNANQVFVGNGSDEVLAHVFNALLKHDKPILFPDVTYSFYPVYCGLYEIEFETVPLNDAFEIKVEDYFKANGGIIFPNPNAPTGRLLALPEIERLLKNNTESVVVIDEAYVDFGGESAVALVRLRKPTRSFSMASLSIFLASLKSTAMPSLSSEPYSNIASTIQLWPCRRSHFPW